MTALQPVSVQDFDQAAVAFLSGELQSGVAHHTGVDVGSGGKE